MKTHTTQGAEILASVQNELGIMARTICLYHHEWYDGTGYWGKFSCDLPVYVPIVSICDVFVALLSEGNQFCLSQHIDTYASGIFTKLKAENFLANTESEGIPERLTYYLSEINVLHPFREGNGRAQRVFIEYLARTAGYHVDFSTVSAEEMIEASALSFAREYDSMTEMFRRIVSPVSPQERQIFHKAIGIDRQNPNR